jgi:hypothetical protein
MMQCCEMNRSVSVRCPRSNRRTAHIQPFTQIEMTILRSDVKWSDRIYADRIYFDRKVLKQLEDMEMTVKGSKVGKFAKKRKKTPQKSSYERFEERTIK